MKVEYGFSNHILDANLYMRSRIPCSFHQLLVIISTYDLSGLYFLFVAPLGLLIDMFCAIYHSYLASGNCCDFTMCNLFINEAI